jgi:radical SAM superfamily enzyme YgiQ (UPF0313 family)
VKDVGILLHGDFIIGLPSETKDSIHKTRQLINTIRPEILQVSIATPLPGTEFYNWARQCGYLTTDDPSKYLDEHGSQRTVINYPGLSSKDIEETVSDILKSYYLTPTYLPLAFRQIFRKNGLSEMVRIYRSALSFLDYSREHLKKERVRISGVTNEIQ